MDNRGAKRAYVSPSRARGTMLLRQRILDEAAEQLAGQGYFGARMRGVADGVGCSQESVYGLVGPKSELMLQVYLKEFGDLMAPVEGHVGLASALRRADVDEAIRLTVDLLAPWTPLTAGVWVAATEAAPEVSELRTLVHGAITMRRSGCEHVAQHLVAEPWRQDVAASVYVMTSAETHLMLTRDVTFSEDVCRSWVVDALRSTLAVSG